MDKWVSVGLGVGTLGRLRFNMIKKSQDIILLGG
jgi:hypothetical protein